MTRENSDNTDENWLTDTTTLATASSTYKVLGEDALASGAGVLGKNTADSGTPIGVEGAVPNADGYGLSTPHDARVEGAMATTGEWQVDVDGDQGMKLGGSDTFTANSTTFEGSGNLIGGHLTQVTTDVVGAVIGGGGLYNQDDGTYRRNTVTDHFATVGGGYDNTAGDDDSDLLSAIAPTVAGGRLNTASGSDATVGGGTSNTASASNATVAGGDSNTASARDSTVGGGDGNTASASDATVAGGVSNTASESYATVSGGHTNKAEAAYAAVGGGGFNTARTFGSTIAGGDSNDTYDEYDTIGGGKSNQAGTADGDTTTATHATVAGGESNTASAAHATVGGGNSSDASETYATVAGGSNNTASGQSAAVGGGAGNSAQTVNSVVVGGFTNTASGDNATVAGGSNNVASGNYSFAAGREADASNAGAFVWSDSGSTTFSSTAADQFLINAAGGVGVGTASPSVALDVEGDANVSGSAIANAVTVSTDATVNGDLAADSVKTATSGNTLQISGDAKTNGSHTVTNNLTVSTDTTLNGAATVGGDTSVGGDLDVTGTIRRDAMTQVYLGSLFTVPSGSQTTLPFSSEVVDEPGAWDTSNYTYTCPQAGHYEVTFNVKFVNSFSGDTQVVPTLSVNGSTSYKWQGTAFAGELYERSFTATLTSLNNGDVVEFSIRQDSGGDKDMPYGDTGTRGSIRYLGDGTA
jgi:hypothetical protein